MKRSVSFETGCPVERIQIVEAMDAGIGHTKFKVDACGQQKSWNRFGTSYFPQGKGPGESAALAGVGDQLVQPTDGLRPGAPAQERGSTTPAPENGGTNVQAGGPPPVAPQGAPSAAGPVEREEFLALLQRVSDLEMRLEGKKTNAQLLADLTNSRDDGWQARLEAAKLLGERGAQDAVPALEEIVASAATSPSLKRYADVALGKIRSSKAAR